MELQIKTFKELSSRELYEILRLRSEVFIVEQQGCYQELDGIDYDSTHIFFTEQNRVTGCIRVFAKTDEKGTCQLGRLVSARRLQGTGRKLMATAEEIARRDYGAKRIFLTGRRSARGFYEKCGYQAQVPPEYNEENAPYFLFRKDL